MMNLNMIVCNYIKCGDELMPPIACPTEGGFIGWKQVYNVDADNFYQAIFYIAKLYIPPDARRTSYFGGGKCRCDKALVLELQNADGTPADIKVAYSYYYLKNRTEYKPGEWVYADSYDPNRNNECTHGIHFFITREEVLRY